MPPDMALLSTLTGSNYPCLELIFKVPKVFEPLKFDYTGLERTGHTLCIVDTSLSVLMTLRMCLRELCCRFGIIYCLDLNHFVRVFYLFMFS